VVFYLNAAFMFACSSSYSGVIEDPERTRGELAGEETPVESDTADTAVTGSRRWDSEAGGEEVSEEESTGGEWVCDKEIRNGSEICDDARFDVPDPYQTMAIVCVTGEGGIGYVSTNTGPTMEDGIARCQGWEENNQNAWDYLDYIHKVTCTEDGQVLEIDLGNWEGRGLYTGVHDHPNGGGHMTHTCIAVWTPNQ
jgi:hypothetical protein